MGVGHRRPQAGRAPHQIDEDCPNEEPAPGPVGRPTTARDIANAGLERIFDLFSGAISMVLDPGQERIEALGLVPRREDRRGQPGSDSPGGGTSAPQTSAPAKS